MNLPRMFARIAGAVCLCASLLCCTSEQSNAADAKRPNIVILYADDMGYGDLAVQNPKSKIPTPNLDRLAASGVRFTDAHSSSGICTPSRYAMLTGGYHWRKFHKIVDSFDPSVFDRNQPTLPGLLQTAGYRTACIGKWHLGWGWDSIKRDGAKPDGKNGYAPKDFDWTRVIPDGPKAHGFDYYFGDDVPNFPPYTWIENDRVLIEPTESLTTTPPTAEGNFECRPGPMAKDWQLDRVMPELTRRAVAWLDAQKGSDQPFFFYFPFTSPHAPIVPTAEFQGKSSAGGYGDYVVQTDATVGQVLEALDRNGLSENTIVIFSADNGPETYAYPRIRNFEHQSMGELRGLKRDIWEGGHRVPMIIRWPGVTKAGRVTGALMSQIDLMATLAAALELPLSKDAAPDSLNQMSVIRGSDTSVRTSLVHNTNKDHYAVRDGDWLYIAAKSGEVSKAPKWWNDLQGYEENPHNEALYNLRDDLGQKHNIVESHPQRAADMKKLLAEIRNSPQRKP